MRIIFDTNVILSALITHGLSTRVLDICIDFHALFISQFIIDEVSEKLKSKFNTNTKDTKKVKSFLLSNFILVKPKGVKPDICRDRDDNNILHLSESIQADLIITGDKDLLILNSYNKTRIISPREFMEKYYKGRP